MDENKDSEVHNNSGNNYIYELEDWNKNQYNPGHYIGGKVPHFITSPGRPDFVALLLLFIAILISLAYGAIVINEMYGEIHELIILSIIMLGAVALLSISAFRSFKKASKELLLKDCKVIGIVSGIIAMVIICIFLLNNFYIEQDEIIVNSRYQYILKVSYNAEYIYIKEKDLKIKWKEENANKEFVYDSRNYGADGKLSRQYKIVYEWSKINPENKRLVKIE